jgi:hypothetical protein
MGLGISRKRRFAEDFSGTPVSYRDGRFHLHAGLPAVAQQWHSTVGGDSVRVLR